jgi:hypothetical protein
MSEGKTPPPPATGALTARIDRALADWPSSKRTTPEWDDAAEQVMSHIGARDPSRKADLVSDEDLLRAPLPMSPNEVQSSAPVATGSEASNMSNTSNTSSRERDRASLQDLAKLAASSPPSSKTPASGAFFGSTPSSKPDSEPGEAKQENSGMINLGAMAAEEAAKTAAAAKPAADGMSTMRSAERVVAEPAKAKPATTSKSEKKATPWVAVSGIVAVAAVAAGVFFGMRSSRPEPSAVAVANAPPATPAVVTAKQPSTQPAAATPLPPAEQGVDPSTLPAAGQPAQAVASLPGRAAPSGPVRATGTPAATTTASAALVAVIPTTTAPAPTSSDQNLQSMMQQAAGPTATATPAAAPTTTDSQPAPGSVALKPSQGAIQGALGAALPGARACLGADDPISHATITFKSDGSVQNVAVSGGAAGKSAEGCIRAALSKARVAPFAQPTFTASTTVRPN